MNAPTYRSFSVSLAAGAALLSLATCDSSGPQDNFQVTYAPDFAAATWVPNITNTFLPLIPGTILRFEGETGDGSEEVVVEVLPDTRVVAGVTARVVRDRGYLDGELIEDTFDWFAQDADGNVWYLGEDTREYEDGQVISTAGSWEAGVAGARAGVLMPATPTVGQAYYQELAEGVAEDRGEVVATDVDVTVPYGALSGCIRTLDTTPLEPDAREHKTYCPGIGTVLELDLGSNERLQLVEVTLP